MIVPGGLQPVIEWPAIATFSQLGYMGELGNQLFQVAATYAYAKRWNKKPVFPEWTCKISGRDYRKIFKNPVDQTLSQDQFQHVRSRFSYDGLMYENLNFTEGSVEMHGYFQSEKYFQDFSEEIKSIFAPADSITDYIQQKYSDVLSEKNKVALHIRTAKRASNDYDVHSSASYEFIEESQSHFSDNLYVVFADNMEIAKTILPEGKSYFFVENEENYTDLFFMTMFDKYIVSPSTFGWWGAWLSQNQQPLVTIKKDWFAIGKSKEHLNINDIVPDRWIKI
jgi:hypothetical protein